MIKLQPSEVTDYITEEGQELTKLPYPFYFDREGIGACGRVPYVAIGFVTDPSARRIDLHWTQYIADGDLQAAVGKYLITRDKNMQWSTQVAAIRSVEER